MSRGLEDSQAARPRPHPEIGSAPPGRGGRRMSTRTYNRFLLLVAGFGGLLLGLDGGIMASALPYVEATAGLSAQQLSFAVAAVLLGGAISTLFAGALADWFGRKRMLIVSGLLCSVSIPAIAWSHGYAAFLAGRLLQGLGAGLIGVVVPLYLAECLRPEDRGRGTGIFQWLLTFGIVVAALIGSCFSLRVDAVVKLGNAEAIRACKELVWRQIFWVSLPPAVVFVAGSLAVAESPRWLHRRGRRADALRALLCSRSAEVAQLEIREMAVTAQGRDTGTARDSLWRRKYVVPFLLACVILTCTQACGVAAVIGYNTSVLIQSGLSDVEAHAGYVMLTAVNFLVTTAAVVLVDRKGRKFLLTLGAGGLILSLVALGVMFRHVESRRVDCARAVQTLVGASSSAAFRFDPDLAGRLLASAGFADDASRPTRWTLTVIYSCGDFRAATSTVRSDDAAAPQVRLSRSDVVPANRVIAFFSNPWGDYAAAQSAPVKVEHALVVPVPTPRHGWIIAGLFCAFMAFFALGPGVCVWLALSELMPTRIRSIGMSIALLLNSAVATVVAATFLPTVGQYGYAVLFFGFAGCTMVYFLTAALFLPETKGKTLEEIEAHFAGSGPAA